MAFVDLSNPTERKKFIALIIIGSLAILSLAYTFGPSFFSSSTPRTSSETPKEESKETESQQTENTRAGAASNNTVTRLPELSVIEKQYASLPITYRGNGASGVPVSARNIFAFYEPGDPLPPPIPEPTPIRTPIPPTPDPPKILVSFVQPTSVYAGSKTFTLQVNGDKFNERSRIVFNGAPLRTRLVSEQRLTAQVPANLIARAYTGSIMIDEPNSDLFSRQVSFRVQEPPKPTYEYIGMIARQHYNNDTAYFQKKGARSGTPIGARLNDVVEGRFKVVSISAKEVEFEDTRLGFRHKVPLERPKPGENTRRGRSGYGNSNRRIPGINPRNVRRSPRRTTRRTTRRPTRRTTRTPRPVSPSTKKTP